MINLYTTRHLFRLSCLLGCFMVGLVACQQHDKQQVSYPDTSDVDDQSTVTKAKAGDPVAQAKLGWMYSTAHHAPKDVEKGIAWYTIAGNNGDHNAQFNLGVIYGNGQGVPKDYKKAAYWYRKAADQGDKDAQYSVGVFFDRGYGVPSDHKEAAQWYKLAAEQDLPIAQYDLAVSYRNGDGVTRDNKKAAYWYQKAGENGVVRGMTGISDMCAEGLGVKQDYVCAYQWLKLALLQTNLSDPDNDKRLIEIEKKHLAQYAEKISINEREQADVWVKNWITTHSR